MPPGGQEAGSLRGDIRPIANVIDAPICTVGPSRPWPPRAERVGLSY
jgi:hypothetical protein